MQELDDLTAEIVVDCYDGDECMMAFRTVLGDEIPVPVETVFLGMPVDVVAIGAGRAPVSWPPAGVARRPLRST